jgi:UMF1 family MFS transporter
MVETDLDVGDFLGGFIAAESAEFYQCDPAQPWHQEQIDTSSGSGAAFGYWGGRVTLALFVMLLLRPKRSGRDIVGYPPLFGLNRACAKARDLSGRWCDLVRDIYDSTFLWVGDDRNSAKTDQFGVCCG